MIGVVAALTIPVLMTNIRKHIVETRLQHSYALLQQVVKLSQVDNDDLSGWDMSNSETFSKTYITPYLKNNIKQNGTSSFGKYFKITLLNGTTWDLSPQVNFAYKSTRFIQIAVDINGNTKPNQQGIDQFNLYIISVPADRYNFGTGDVTGKITSPGIYYDGYGAPLKAAGYREYRGCGEKNYAEDSYKNAFCVALIARNNWKIPKDYPLKF